MFVIKPMDFSHLSSNQCTFHICHHTNGPFTFVIKPVDLSHLSSNQWTFYICHQTNGPFTFVIKPVDILSSNQWTFHICHQTNGPFKFVPRPPAQWRHSLIDLIMGMQMAARWAGRDRAGLDVLLLLQIWLYACIIHFVCVREMGVVAWLEEEGARGRSFRFSERFLMALFAFEMTRSLRCPVHRAYIDQSQLHRASRI